MSDDVAARASGYTTDVPYVVLYHRELSPTLLKIAVAHRGIAWNPSDAFNYIELGCGFGFSTLIHAAGHPAAQFTGVDIIPEHVRSARARAAAAKLENINFIEGAFADLDTAEFQGRLAPAFDVIALHGVWSWINDENRAHLLRFIDRRLKTGGLLYVSYNTLPGLASVLPLRHLMRMDFDAAGGATEARVMAGVTLAEKLRTAGAAYFTSQPQAALTLDRIKNGSAAGLAHEYFNADWRAFYFDEVAGPLKTSGLTYAGSASLPDNIDHIQYRPEGQELLGKEPQIRREMLKDFLANRTFRSDVFFRGAPPKQTPGELLAAQPFIAAHAPVPGGMFTITTGLGKIKLQPQFTTPVLTALAAAPLSVRDLLTHPVCTGMKPNEILDTVVMLSALKLIQPAAPGEAGKRREAAGRLNSVLWHEAEIGRASPANVSPVSGEGITMDRAEQLFLLALHRGEDPVAFAKAIADDDDTAAAYGRFSEKRLPTLRALGVI